MRKGATKNIEGLIPMFTVEIHLRQLTLSQQTFINTHSKELFGCSRQTLWEIRFNPMVSDEDFKAGKFTWSPMFITVVRIANYFGLPVDAMINRSRRKIVEGEQLRFIDPNKEGSTQLEIIEALNVTIEIIEALTVTKNKKATA